MLTLLTSVPSARTRSQRTDESPAAGTTNVAAPAAIGRSAIAARMRVRLMVISKFSFGELTVGGWQCLRVCAPDTQSLRGTSTANRQLPTANCQLPTANQLVINSARHGHPPSRF